MKSIGRASIVIVGGGVMGTSIAFHLAEAGVEDVLLIERAELGAGSTAKGAGGVRAMFSDELNVRIGMRSLEAWGAFGERPGAEIDLRRVGYLFLLSSADELAQFEHSVEMQNRLGLPSRIVSLEEAAELCPVAGLDGVLAGAFCPLAGYATPDAAVQGYATAARALGVRIETHTDVTGIEDGAVLAGGRVIETDCVVCAAGTGSGAVGATAGVELAVRPELRRIAHTAALAGLPDGPLPMTIDFASGFYFHREGPGLLFGTNDVCDTQDEWLERAVPVLRRRAPLLLDAPIAGGWWGDYEMTPDHNALIGEAPAAPGRFLYATGFSGHGFQQAPAIGEIVRDLYLGREPFVDVSALAAGRPERRERNVV
ncbi:MAG TPA: FAD-binding oxidoreductase [Thermoleophilaceae bacterium]|nr:FAD-binding oxidoreductase [Thermoleophilaceae bacterium]